MSVKSLFLRVVKHDFRLMFSETKGSQNQIFCQKPIRSRKTLAGLIEDFCFSPVLLLQALGPAAMANSSNIAYEHVRIVQL